MQRVAARASGFVMVAAAAAACSSSQPAPPPAPPADEIAFEVFPTTTILSREELASLTSARDGTLTFAAAPASLANVDIGHVIVASVSPATPNGLLRVVTDVRRNGAELVLATRQAPLALAFRKLHVKSRRDITGIGNAAWQRNDLSTRSLRPQDELLGGTADAELPLDFLLYDADDNPSTTNDQIGIKGSLGGGFHYGISVDVDWGDVFDLPNAVKTCVASLARIVEGTPPDCSITALLPEVKVGFEVDPFMKAHATLSGAASLSYEKNFDIATISLPTIPIGPIVFFPTIDVTATVSGEASAGFTVGAHGSLELESSLAISSKHLESPDVKPMAVKDATFAADDTKVVLQASAKVGVGARLNVELYGIVGPYAQATSFVKVQADAFGNPCWQLHVGVDTALGVRVTSPDIPFLGSVTLLDWKGLTATPVDETIASGACLPVEKGPPLPPGSGPDAPTFASPTFTRWAHVSTPVGDDGAVHSFLEDGLEWSDDVLAIDGRYVAVGSRNEAAVKFDDGGNVIWSKRYRREAASPPFRLRRVVSTHDAGMLVLVEAQDGEPASVMKIGQAGGVYFRKRIALAPEAGCDFGPYGLARDAQKGFFVLGTCNGGEKSALAHLDENGAVLGVTLFGDAAPKDRSIEPSALAMMGSDVVVMGATDSTSEGSRMFAIRLAEAGGAAVWAKRVIGCSDAPDLHPSQARMNANAQLTVVGTAADHRDGLVLRIQDDGSVPFASFSRFDTTGSNPFNLHAFAELPTTGLVVAGSTQNLGIASGQPGTETSLFVAGLDSIGRALWAKRYTLPNLRSMNHASLHLTDDGGVLVTGIAQHTTGPGGSLYAMKAFAKDGDLGGAPGVAVSTLTLAEPLACAVQVEPWQVAVSTAAATTSDVPTVVEDAGVSFQ